MYKINRGPSQIVVKTRGGVSQNIDKFNAITASSKKSESIDLSTPSEHNNIPRPVFQRRLSKRIASAKQIDNVATLPQNEDIINFVNDSWNMLVTPNPSESSTTANCAESPEENNCPSSLATVWIEPNCPELEDFKPFDLESWWSHRLFEKITKDL